MSARGPIFDAWRAGATWDQLVTDFDLNSKVQARTLIASLTTAEERQARRSDQISAAMERYTEGELLDLLSACAADLGRTPGAKAFDQWDGGHRAQLLIMRFGSWSEACRIAGLEPNPRRGGGERTYSDADELAAYVRIEAETDSVTVAAWEAVRVPGEPAEGTLRRRYGSCPAFKDAIADRRVAA